METQQESNQKNNLQKTCILLQTNDDYEFLWEGLYLSWKLNWIWDIYNFPVYVITETKDFRRCHPSCDFQTINVGEDILGPENYSTKLIRGLLHLKEKGFDNIIYCQDDSWPYTSPDSRLLDKIFELFESENLDAFYFHEHRSHFPFTVNDIGISLHGKRVKEFYGISRFYYNHGCGLWKIDSLLDIQKPNEGPYENERLATERCWVKKPKIYLLNYAWYDQELIHENGKLKESALKIINDLVFRFAWEYKDGFMFNYVANDGSIIPIPPSDKKWESITWEETTIIFNESYGFHFSHYL
jgi:hypothetical protein